jgi:hypothetical protein
MGILFEVLQSRNEMFILGRPHPLVAPFGCVVVQAGCCAHVAGITGSFHVQHNSALVPIDPPYHCDLVKDIVNCDEILRRKLDRLGEVLDRFPQGYLVLVVELRYFSRL